MLSVLLTFALAVTGTMAAGCECGYTVNRTDSEKYAVFTELFESDFLHMDDAAFKDVFSSGWIPQTYNQSMLDSNAP